MNSTRFSNRRGVALITTLIFCAMLLVIAGSVFSWAVMERKLAVRTAAVVEARNAAEGIAEFGFSQVAQLASSDSVVFSEATTDTKQFKDGQPSALQLPDMDFFNGGHVVQTGTNAPELYAGTITKVVNGTSTELYRYVSTVNNNNKDSVRDRWVERRDIRVIAKATVNVPGLGDPITSYVEERISVRGSPLFTAAIFYNMDLEIHPGPDMKVGGPVIANGNIFINGQGGSNTLAFLGPVSASGDVFHAFKSYLGLVTGATSEVLKAGNVQFLKSGSTTTDMRNAGIWKDSTWGTSTSWYKADGTPKLMTSNQAGWNTLLKTTADTNLAAFSAFAQSEWNGNLQTRTDKAPLPGIPDYSEQTPDSATDNSKNGGRLIIEPAIASGTPGYNPDVEKQKYATKAGLTIIVNPATGAISLKAGATTTPLASLGAGAKPLITWNPYTTSAAPNTTGTVTGGMYDQRQNVGQNLVELDYGVLRTITAEMQKGSPDTSKTIPGLTPSTWTGVIYVEVQGGPTTVGVNDLPGHTEGETLPGTTAAGKTSLRIRNAENNLAAGLSTPSCGTLNPGLTIATNAPVYVLGNFNADGNQGTGSLTAPDETVKEQPAAIVGDAVTFLSKTWASTSTAGSVVTDADKKSNRTNYSSNVPVAAESEVAAAIITGITPTNKNGANQNSGGAHNILRYLENWSGKKNTVRGSLVCLYESRVHDKRFLLTYYSPPIRQWGLNSMFTTGRFPPGTPLSITFRRGYYREISAGEFEAAKSSATF